MHDPSRSTTITTDSLKEEEITELTEKEIAELIIEAEEVIRAIRDGEMEGEYFEF